MAVKLIANYAKRLGLPGYSSHQFSVSVETELLNVTDVAGEAAHLYATLQNAVDQQIQQTGFVPPDGYGLGNGNGAAGSTTRNTNGHNGGHSNGRLAPDGTNGQRRAFSDWSCTEGQKGFILRLTSENNLDKEEIEALAQQLFGAGVKQLDKMQASQLIEELLEKTGRKASGDRGGHYRRQEVRK